MHLAFDLSVPLADVLRQPIEQLLLFSGYWRVTGSERRLVKAFHVLPDTLNIDKAARLCLKLAVSALGRGRVLEAE